METVGLIPSLGIALHELLNPPASPCVSQGTERQKASRVGAGEFCQQQPEEELKSSLNPAVLGSGERFKDYWRDHLGSHQPPLWLG